MTEEEIQALQAAKTAAEQKAADAEALALAAKAEAEKAKEDVTKVVSELTEERRKKNEALAKAGITNEQPDVNTLIEQALAAKEQERRRTDLEEAIAEFKSGKTEFQSDAAGLVFEKFKNELKKFNFSDVSNKSQAKARLEEVYRFVNGSKSSQEEDNYNGTTRSDASIPNKDGQLPREMESVLEAAKIDKDKYTKLKTKYGDAFSGLGIN